MLRQITRSSSLIAKVSRCNHVQIRWKTGFSRLGSNQQHHANTIRDNLWIGGGNFIEQDPKYYSRMKSLNDVTDPNSLYVIDKEFQEDILTAHFVLEKNAISGRLRYKHYNDVFENGCYKELMTTALRYFSDKLYYSLLNYKEQLPVKLEDVLVPSIDSLPNLIKNISNPLIQNYFKSLKISSKQDQIYYLIEKTLHKTYSSLKINRTPPQSIKVDISNPSEWFPKARKMKRKIIMHVGPTNSGKTYNALKRLKESNNGYFAGPLRLLAREIYDRFKTEGIRCNLVTGEDVIEDLDQYGNKATLSSGTVEMIDLNAQYDVVVLDEIQMISDENRGWAWTTALLGAQSKEIHLCGEERSVPLIKEILKSTGDEIIINKYERLGKLIIEKEPLAQHLNDLKKGDCIVVFSKKRILSYKLQIENDTNLKCGVIYGALPAEVRSTEASKFNNGEYDVLVASDAIGMGLNLKINRVIFDSHMKFDGQKRIAIHPAHIKQIGGRAGRFKISPNKNDIIEDLEIDLNDDKSSSVGYVSAFEPDTLTYVQDCFAKDIKDLEKATIWPSDEIWSHYMSEYPAGAKFSVIMKAFTKEVESSSNIYETASIIDKIQNVSIFDKIRYMLVSDQLRISNIPLNLRIDEFEQILMNFGLQVTKSETKTLLDFGNMYYEKNLANDIDKENKKITTDELSNLETLHKKLMAWLWMNNRYPTLFVDREGAEDLKTLVEYKIEEALESLHKGKIDKRSKYGGNTYKGKKPSFKRTFKKKN